MMLPQLLQSALELVHSRHDLPGRLLAFCLCNLIVAVLIVSRHAATPPPRAPGPHTARETDAQGTLFLGVSAADVGGYVNDGLEVAAAGGGWAEEHDGAVYDQEGNGEQDQVDRRAEEFIAQMNRVWREELRRDRQDKRSVLQNSQDLQVCMVPPPMALISPASATLDRQSNMIMTRNSTSSAGDSCANMAEIKEELLMAASSRRSSSSYLSRTNSMKSIDGGDFEDPLYIAVAKEYKEGKSTLMWALRHNRRVKKFMLVNIHCPSQMIPICMLLFVLLC